jgi:hypothetical protein
MLTPRISAAISGWSGTISIKLFTINKLKKIYVLPLPSARYGGQALMAIRSALAGSFTSRHSLSKIIVG